MRISRKYLLSGADWSVTSTVLVLRSRIYLISGGLGPGRSGAVPGWSRESELLLWVLSREIATIVLVLIKLQFIFSEAEVESRQNGGVVCNSKVKVETDIKILYSFWV
jgi:hypothetical protein